LYFLIKKLAGIEKFCLHTLNHHKRKFKGEINSEISSHGWKSIKTKDIKFELKILKQDHSLYIVF